MGAWVDPKKGQLGCRAVESRGLPYVLINHLDKNLDSCSLPLQFDSNDEFPFKKLTPPPHPYPLTSLLSLLLPFPPVPHHQKTVGKGCRKGGGGGRWQEESARIMRGENDRESKRGGGERGERKERKRRMCCNKDKEIVCCTITRTHESRTYITTRAPFLFKS